LNRIYLGLLSVVMFSGCASIDQSLLLNKDTKVEIINATEDVFFRPGPANSQQTIEIMVKRIMGLTRDELAARHIDAYTTPTPGAAKLIFEIKTVSTGQSFTDPVFGIYDSDKFEIKYRVIFENPRGKRIYINTDEKNDGDIDVVFEKIASSEAENVARYFNND